MNHDELVEKMLDAAVDAGAVRRPGTIAFASMSAALRVAVEEVLAPVNIDEIRMHNDARGNRARLIDWGDIQWYLAYRRRSNYLKPKSAEERVTLHEGVGDYESWTVCLDGRSKASFGIGGKEDAEIYRLGLIQKLKSEEK